MRTLSLFLFWALPLSAQEIVQVEYFVDSDPGRGDGKRIELSAADSLSLNFTADLSDLHTGIHVLYVRGRDSQGHWSLLRSHPFVVETVASDSLPAITQIEYYFVGVEIKTLPVLVGNFSADTELNLQQSASLNDLTVGASYDLYLSARDAWGRSSPLVSHSFTLDAATLVGDFDGSGLVDFADFFLFADFFGSEHATYDLDGSGLVDFADFFLFADSFGLTAGE